MKVDVKECARLLLGHNKILILTHAHPDGDTLGCGFGLCRALLKLGKEARVINADDIPKKYDYLYDDMESLDFREEYIVSVDTATENLLGDLAGTYGGKIDLCIDHHGTNAFYAKCTLMEEVAAACEIIYRLILEMEKISGQKNLIDKKIADCLYTGISTDTGCFRYASSTPETYRIAADLMALGADNGTINRVMFETKTKPYCLLEKEAINGLKMFENDRIAVITITQEMYEKTGTTEQDTEAIAPLTRQIEGVEIGITIREKKDGTCKASFRTYGINAAEIAAAFGGGGHRQASACRLNENVETTTKLIVEKCREILNGRD